MTLEEAMARLEALADPRVRTLEIRNGAGDDQFGVKLGDIRTLAKAIKTDHPLALQLWATGNLDARLLATLILKPKLLAAADLDSMVRENRVIQLADWLGAYVVKAHPEKEALRQQWMASDHPMAARVGWSLTAERVAKNPHDLDLEALLDRIDAELPRAAPEPQWTMNMTLATIGIHFPEHRARALAIGEKHGIYRDYPTSPGCTSPYAPDWINELVRRREAG